jgi:hypothetical protein
VGAKDAYCRAQTGGNYVVPAVSIPLRGCDECLKKVAQILPIQRKSKSIMSDCMGHQSKDEGIQNLLQRRETCVILLGNYIDKNYFYFN